MQLSNIRDANSNLVRTIDLVALVVQITRHNFKVDFSLCERLAASVFPGCIFCDRFFKGIYLRAKKVKMDDESIVPIVSKPRAKPPKAVSLPDELEYDK